MSSDSNHRHESASPVAPVTIAECVLVGCIAALGIGIRCYYLPGAAVEHFDEGVYASNLWFDADTGYRYPMQHFYAPPLLPWLIKWTMVLVGNVSGPTPLLPSLVAGIATLVVVWWLARSWYGPASAAAATCLLAFSDVHRMFSLAALTDVLLLFWLVVALGIFCRACRTGCITDYVLAGLLTGLAWWTKYNGWLPLIIAWVGMAAWYLTQRPVSTRPLRMASGWCVAALTAAIVWSPWLYSLQQYGGYGEIAANHRLYIVGLSGWIPSLFRQIANLQAVDTLWGSLGWGAAVFAAGSVLRLSRSPVTASNKPLSRDTWCWITAASFVAIAIAQVASATVCCLVVAAAAVAVDVVQRLRHRHEKQPDPGRYFYFYSYFSISWLLVMFLLTPLYTPYLRLMLPLLGAAWLASGHAVDRLVNRIESRASRARSDSKTTPALNYAISGVVIISSVCLIAFGPRSAVGSLKRHDRDSWKQIATEIGKAARLPNPSNGPSPAEPRVFYVYGEPALFFQLRAAGEVAVAPVSNLDLETAYAHGRPVPTFLVCGLHAEHDPQFLEQMKIHEQRFELLQTFRYHPSTLVLLDQFDPREMDLGSIVAEVRLYRIKEKGNSKHDNG